MSMSPADTQSSLKKALELHQKGDLNGAEIHYQEALSGDPNNYTALANVGTIYLSKGQWQSAERSFKWASLAKEPSPDLYHKLGVSLQQQGKLDDALKAYQKALLKHPQYPEVYKQLGMLYHQQGNLEEAIIAFKKTIELQPNTPNHYYNLGYALQSHERFAEAIPYYEQTLKLEPRFAPAHSNLAIALQKQGRLQDSLNAFQQAIILQPNDTDLYYHYALSLREAERLDETILAFKKAIELKPDHANAHYSLAHILLLQNHYASGWPEYEWRIKAHPENFKIPHFEMWTGSADAGSEIVLIEEQGLGDLLQFLRYGLLLKQQFPVVSIATQSKFCPLVELTGIFDKVYPLPMDTPSIPKDAMWQFLLSIPALLNVTSKEPLIKDPYLKTDPQVSQLWLERIHQKHSLIVGLNWQGNPQIEVNEFKGRSFPLSTYESLASIPDVQFVSLQKGFGSEQLANCSFLDKFVACHDEINETWDLVETAAIVNSCDLVITSDTSIAHLAGALGKPVWILLKKIPDWRWGLEGESTAWYPTARLFRQTHDGNWAEVIERVKTELQKFL